MKNKIKNKETVKTPWYGSYGEMPKNLEYKNTSLYDAVLETSQKHPG